VRVAVSTLHCCISHIPMTMSVVITCLLQPLTGQFRWQVERHCMSPCIHDIILWPGVGCVALQTDPRADKLNNFVCNHALFTASTCTRSKAAHIQLTVPSSSCISACACAWTRVGLATWSCRLSTAVSALWCRQTFRIQTVRASGSSLFSLESQANGTTSHPMRSSLANWLQGTPA
jgi:hypothetical protein